MSRLRKRVADLWDFVNRIHSLGIVLAAATLTLMALAVCYEVVLRYIFKAPTHWGLDISEFLMVACGFIGASYVLMKGKHVRVELLISHLPPKGRLISEILSFLMMFSYFSVLIWKSWEMTWRSFTMNWRTPDLAMLPYWPAQLVIPLSGLLLLLAAIDRIYAYIKLWRSEHK